MSDNREACEYASRYYGVPADIGRRVLVGGKPGVIAEDRGAYIGVNFDRDAPHHIVPCHPVSQVEYLGMGNVRPMTRSQARYRRYLDSDGCFENFRDFLKYEQEQRGSLP